MQNVDFLNIQYIFYKIYEFFANFSLPNFMETIMRYWPITALVSLLVSILLLIGIIYYFLKLEEIKKEDEKKYGEILSIAESDSEEIRNERWIRVLDHLDTESPAEWRSAILEADIILDEMTKKMGYLGDNLGERLRGVEKSDFNTLDQAWEAHKVRNIIAHEGSNYILTKREAKKIIDLYRQVFEEFEFI